MKDFLEEFLEYERESFCGFGDSSIKSHDINLRREFCFLQNLYLLQDTNNESNIGFSGKNRVLMASLLYSKGVDCLIQESEANGDWKQLKMSLPKTSIGDHILLDENVDAFYNAPEVFTLVNEFVRCTRVIHIDSEKCHLLFQEITDSLKKEENRSVSDLI